MPQVCLKIERIYNIESFMNKVFFRKKIKKERKLGFVLFINKFKVKVF